jgi:hypothetical protein
MGQTAYLRMLNAQRCRRWRHRHRDWVRSLQFKLQDAEAKIAHRDQVIEMLRWELRYQTRREKFQSWLIGNMPIEDDEPPKESDPNCS